MEEKNVALKPCLSHFVGERRPRPSNLPPTARRGGGGPRSGGGGRRRRHYKKLAVKPPPPPSEPGPRSGPSSRPLPSRCARHPPREGGGQVTWRRRTLPQTLPIPFCGGEGDHALQTCLPPLVGGRGTTKWWKGAAEGGIIKTAAKPLPPPSEPFEPFEPSEPSSRRCVQWRVQCAQIISKILLSAGEVPAPAFSGGRRD